MKIVIFQTYNKSLLTDFFLELSDALLKENNEVVWFSLKNQSKVFKENGKIIIINKKGNYLKNYQSIFKILKKEKPDMVIANFSYVNPVMLFSYLLRIKKRVIWFHTLKNHMKFSKKQIFIKSLFMKISTHIISNSIELKDEIIKDYRQQKNKVTNLPFITNIINVEPETFNFEKKKSEIYIGCPGRLHPDKNQQILLDCLKILSNPKLNLVFAGGGNTDLITTHREYSSFKEQIIFTGVLSKNEMKSFYKEMDLIILPSFNEAFGLVFIESLALGSKTLVSNKFGSIDYIKDDISDFTFNPNDEKELASKIDILINEEISHDFFSNLYIDNFNMNLIANNFLKFIMKN